MATNPSYEKELQPFPAAMRELIEAELAIGNQIVEIASRHPAPMAGAYVKLAHHVTTRPRADFADIKFYERNSSSYSGEFYDAKRYYFVLEPPREPPPPPDMDAIREELAARERAANADRFRENGLW